MKDQQRSGHQWFFGCFGSLLFLVSSPFVVAMIHDLIVGTDNLTGALVAGSFFSVLTAVSVFMLVFALRKPRAREFRVTGGVEREVLGIARRHSGRLSVSELALECDYSLDQCQAALTHLEHRDVARTHISSDGDIVYVFPHFDGDFDKESTFDPLDDGMVFDHELADAIDAEDDVRTAAPAEVTDKKPH